MAPQMEWPDFSSISNPMEQLVQLSRFYGGDPDFVLAGGGNTSIKMNDRLFVKGSGTTLAEIDADGFVEQDRGALDALLDAWDPEEAETAREGRFKDAVMAARLYPEKGQRPSVECVLHNILPGKFAVHTHPAILNMVTCGAQGESLCQELFGDAVLWLPYTTPGFVLAHVLEEGLAEHAKRTAMTVPDAVLMGNHGLILCGDTPDELKEKTDRLCAKVQERLGALSEEPFGAIDVLSGEVIPDMLRLIAPALRALLGDDAALKIVLFDDSPLAKALACGENGKEIALEGALSPDQIVYCKSLPLWVKVAPDASMESVVELLNNAVEGYQDEQGFPPQVIAVEGMGLFCAGDTWKAANTVREGYLDAVLVMAGAIQLGGLRAMSLEERTFIENWEVESYRRSVAAGSAKPGRADGKVALVTGAAQGFGLQIAQDLAAEGAHVILADLNVEGAEKEAKLLEEKWGAGRATALSINVANAESIADALTDATYAYGGLDLFLSNAGVLKAGSVKELPEKDFDFVTMVNYKGYFLCVQGAAPILAVQHAARPEAWGDIIQINSKSGLVGSNKNGAYAGSKFGGIGLTQSFALELVADGIKVNSICPGNFFDGPLWSDPENGLFVQYLNAGKVPGAKSIADVKAHYERQVPMQRGCTTPDVMKAIYYLLEQRYETGQAVPVTGGQVMLS
jgi:rhamnose utilization protein RhaD (predicted bifunctional aldolase and dehydrogenase)/NAD(P)-dependent dehydrogenase (short-subunit alcohol dehydrogenase family)